MRCNLGLAITKNAAAFTDKMTGSLPGFKRLYSIVHDHIRIREGKLTKITTVGLYILCSVVVIKVVVNLGRWVWTEIKQSLKIAQSKSTALEALKNDITTKAEETFTPLVDALVDQINSLPEIDGKAKFKEILEGERFMQAKASLISAIKKDLEITQEEINAHINTVLGTIPGIDNTQGVVPEIKVTLALFTAQLKAQIVDKLTKKLLSKFGF